MEPDSYFYSHCLDYGGEGLCNQYLPMSIENVGSPLLHNSPLYDPVMNIVVMMERMPRILRMTSDVMMMSGDGVQYQ